MTQNRGYMLPLGDAFTDDIACTLVFYPDKDEYRRALAGSLDYLATWTAWERDAEKRGKDAARAWKNANELTMECWQMACLESILAELSAIRSLLAQADYCCPDNIVIINPPGIVPIVTDPGVGDPPTVYGETEITTWEEWNDYVCYNAHAYVDLLKEQADQLQDIVEAGAIGIGVIAAILGLLSGAGIVLAIAYGTAAGIVGGLIQASTTAIFADVPTLIEGARENIVRSILCGTGNLADVMADALDGSLSWTLFYQFMSWGDAVAVVRNGGNDGEYLPAVAREDCNCDWIYDIDYEELFATNGGGFWSSTGGSAWHSGQQAVYFRERYSFLTIDAAAPYVNIPLQIGHTYRFVGMRYTLMHAVPVGPSNTYKIWLATTADFGGLVFATRQTQEGGLNPTYNEVIIDLSSWPEFTVSGGTQRLMQFQEYDGIDLFIGELNFYLLDVTP